jgi:bifunctional non-homologous end joining protein LigD
VVTHGEVDVDVGGRSVRLSSLDRVLWPETGTTKGELVDYYVRVAPVLLRHLAGRAVTLHRFPEGVGGPHFYQTRVPPHPDWVKTQRMYTFVRSGKIVDAPVVDDLPSLVWAANLSTIELHPYLGCAGRLEHPTVVVFDLDPGPPAGLADACQVALVLRGLLDDVGLAAFAKTSGVKGVHVYVPLNGEATYDETKAFARAIAALLVDQLPGRVVERMTKTLRPGRVFVDWSQNDPGKSTVVAYSLRGLPRPTVSTPVTWDEVAAGAESTTTLMFAPADALARVERLGDLFAPVLALRQTLPNPEPPNRRNAASR